MSKTVMDIGMRVGAGLLAMALGSQGAAHAAAPVAAPVRYACADSREFIVTRSAASATVVFRDRTYTLQRGRSSIGEKYLSDAAALILDGPSAVFVADDRPAADVCVAAPRFAAR